MASAASLAASTAARAACVAAATITSRDGANPLPPCPSSWPRSASNGGRVAAARRGVTCVASSRSMTVCGAGFTAGSFPGTASLCAVRAGGGPEDGGRSPCCGCCGCGCCCCCCWWCCFSCCCCCCCCWRCLSMSARRVASISAPASISCDTSVALTSASLARTEMRLTSAPTPDTALVSLSAAATGRLPPSLTPADDPPAKRPRYLRMQSGVGVRGGTTNTSARSVREASTSTPPQAHTKQGHAKQAHRQRTRSGRSHGQSGPA